MPQPFEDLFAKWDYDNDGALDFRQFFELIRGNRVAADPFGVSQNARGKILAGTHTCEQWGAAFFEFGTTWLLIQRDGKIYKEDLRGIYDVSIQYTQTIFFDRREQRRNASFLLTPLTGLPFLENCCR